MSGRATSTTAHSGYEDLLAHYQPRPIRSEQEAEGVQAAMDELMDRAEELSDDERDVLLLLGSLMAMWEQEREEEPHVAPHEPVKALLEARGLPQQALVGPVFPSKGVASEVLRGKRKFTYEFVRRLAAYFDLSPAVFYARAEPRASAE